MIFLKIEANNLKTVVNLNIIQCVVLVQNSIKVYFTTSESLQFNFDKTEDAETVFNQIHSGLLSL